MLFIKAILTHLIQAQQLTFIYPNENHIDISIYNLKGEKVRTLISNHMSSGYHNILWDGRSNSDINLPSGIYFINLKYDKYNEMHKVIKIK